MKKKIALLFIFSIFTIVTFSQNDSIAGKKKEKIKKGFAFGGVPALAYDSDTGFKYGLVLNFFHYGDGSNYPEYNHSLFTEWSQTTKGSSRYQVIYDAKKLIPKVRMTVEGSYLTEQALDFYGFNGYKSDFNSNFSDDNKEEYISRMYYRLDRKMFRLKAEFQGNILNEKLRWLAGLEYYDMKISSVDIDKLNKGKSEDKILPDTATLYDKYVEWNIISENEKNGGNIGLIKAGLVYNSRDNEANPNKGIWAEAIVMTAPEFISDFAYSKFIFNYRQYFTIIKNNLTFAYRLSYQTKISGKTPFYMLPFYFDTKQTQDGLGGAKNLRGILRNRVQGDGIALGNMELRWKLYKALVLRQNFYISLNLFSDAGMVIDPYNFDNNQVIAGYGKTREENLETFNKKNESIHSSFGLGVRFVINNNFVTAIDYGRAVNKQDGTGGLYIGLNFIF